VREALDVLLPLRFCAVVELPEEVQIVVCAEVFVEAYVIRHQSDQSSDL